MILGQVKFAACDHGARTAKHIQPSSLIGNYEQGRAREQKGRPLPRSFLSSTSTNPFCPPLSRVAEYIVRRRYLCVSPPNGSEQEQCPKQFWPQRSCVPDHAGTFARCSPSGHKFFVASNQRLVLAPDARSRFRGDVVWKGGLQSKTKEPTAAKWQPVAYVLFQWENMRQGINRGEKEERRKKPVVVA